MEEKYRHFLFGIVASVGLCFIILVFFTGDEILFDFLSFISIVILLVLFVVLAFDIVLLARILCGCHNETKWHIVTECSQDQELRSKRKLLFHPEVTVFPNSVISYCEAVEQVEFASSDCYFMPGSFEGCVNLEYIKLPHRLERIPDNMFRSCSSLKGIIIPSTVKSIGKNAFDGCIGLTSVTFEDTNYWYYTSSLENAANKTGGTEVSVSDTDFAANATLVRSTYRKYYWYKVD